MAKIIQFPLNDNVKNEDVQTGYNYFAKGILDQICAGEPSPEDIQILINTPSGAVFTVSSGRLFSEDRVLILNLGEMVAQLEGMPQ